ncbi:MAG: polymerase subunit sigma-70 [Nocardia sp.]|nr:polymerase subunit sigma-70 [Nocardia sp.]
MAGAAEIGRWCDRETTSCEGARLIPVQVNGSPAFAHYRPAQRGGGYEAFAIHVLGLDGCRIVSIACFLDSELFELPERISISDTDGREGDGPAKSPG